MRRVDANARTSIKTNIKYNKSEAEREMEKISVSDCKDSLQSLGRTFVSQNGGLFCNWTCCGVRFVFHGTALAAKIQGYPSAEQELNAMTAAFESRETWPWIAVFLDDGIEPVQYIEINKKEQIYPLLTFENAETHTVTIRKITENAKGKICLTEFLAEGEITRAKDIMDTQSKKLKLEFIGDSITCGFGNMVKDANRMFYSVDESGWLAHPAVAARKLEAEFSVVSCSGIAISEGIGKFEYSLAPMSYYYPYCDRMAQELEDTDSHLILWDFENHIPDIIVLNLGTNDATVIDLNGDTQAGIAKFEKDYYAFLQMLRQYNGNTPHIICALGSLDYFLYDSIQNVAKQFQKDYQDNKISCFKYGRVRVNDGLGACRHPYVTTQIRMGEELAAYIKTLEC